jgi:hypothetical protein
MNRQRGLSCLALLGFVMMAGVLGLTRNFLVARGEDVVPAPLTRTEIGFGPDTRIEEARSFELSENRQWWLSSGAYFNVIDSIGRTVQGGLPESDPWRIAYARNNPLNTIDGFYPQHIFRLVTRSTWLNQTQEVYFLVSEYRPIESEERNASNGVFFFNRYIDQDNVYYAGFRVDGQATIKKKINGVYYDLAFAPVFESEVPYDPVTAPNLMPVGQWIGMRTEIQTQPDGSVRIELYADLENADEWSLVLSAVDVPGENGGPVFSEAGHAGLRSDFMDAAFSNYQLVEGGR